VFDEGGKNLSVAGLGLGAHQVDDTLCEERIELALSVAIAVGLWFAGVAFKAIAIANTHVDVDSVMKVESDW
jgi:hypothetical protein